MWEISQYRVVVQVWGPALACHSLRLADTLASEILASVVVYSLCALLGRTNDLEPKPRSFENARCVRLGGALSMVPLSEALVGELERATIAVGVRELDTFEFLSAGVEAWAQALSVDTAIAYVETEYFGGEGFERAGVWSEGRLALGPLDGAGSINTALRALGVQPAPGIEEFELVGLGRYRSLEEWLRDASGSDSL